MFNEALAACLASPLLSADCPANPVTSSEALNSSDRLSWQASIEDELASLWDMNIYKLIPHSSVPPGWKILHGKWVFRLKQDEHGNPICFKSRLIAHSFEQIFGQDYVETTSPTLCMESLWLILHLAAVNGWDVQQIDIKTTYCYDELPANETVYMEQPKGFAETSKEDWVWQLQQGLYGMKQSGCIWNKTMNKTLLSWGFKCLSADSCVYYCKTDAGIIIICIYVDNFIIAGSSSELCEAFKTQIHGIWNISDLGDASFCVSLDISHSRHDHTISLFQTALIDHIITTFGLTEAHPISTPMDSNLYLCHPPSN